MAQVWLGSGLRRVRVPNPRKSFVAASVCFYLVSMCACFMPHNYPQRDTWYYSSRSDACMICTYEYIDLRRQVRIMVE